MMVDLLILMMLLIDHDGLDDLLILLVHYDWSDDLLILMINHDRSVDLLILLINPDRLDDPHDPIDQSLFLNNNCNL